MARPDICIYHGNCDDGFTAAWCVWSMWPDIEFHAGAYGVAPPDVSGKHVLMVDFSYKRPVLEEMARQAATITILDHHKTAQEDLAPFIDLDLMDPGHARPAVSAYFDMEHSGAHLAWKYLMNTPPPMFVALVEDRDLWRFKYGEATKRFSASLRTYSMDFQTWNSLINRTDELIADGEAILRAHRSNIGKFLEDWFETRIGGFNVPCVNVPYHYASDTAHELLHVCPDAPFAATCFRNRHGSIQFSLRSEDSRTDVSEVAKAYGGGGHRNAAGFNLKVDDAWPIVRGV